MAKMFSMQDWEKTTIEEVKMRWGNRRREIEEIERKKKEIDDKMEIRKKKKEEEERLERGDALCVEYLGTWPVIAGIEEKRKGDRRCPRINLKF